MFLDFNTNASDIILITFLGSTIIFPLIAIFMMKGLNIIDSVEMKDKKERVGPLLITSLFYVWSFLNFKKYGAVPEYLTFFTLGATISLFASFFITLFEKISLHTVAFSGLITCLVLIKDKYHFYEFGLKIFNKNFLVDSNLMIIFLILILGIISSSRLYLNAHTNKQVYVGCFVGILSMIAGYKFYF
jgi:hypothetical protein